MFPCGKSILHSPSGSDNISKAVLTNLQNSGLLQLRFQIAFLFKKEICMAQYRNVMSIESIFYGCFAVDRRIG